MIILCNLNKYIGGGETLLIRLAQYLQENNVDYHIITSSGDCWILTEAERLGLNVTIWPSSNDSIAYQTPVECCKVIDALSRVYGRLPELRIFTFCMRDLYNMLYVFTRLPQIKAYFSHGIYHPEDVFYLSSISLQPEKYKSFNRSLVQALHKARSVLFVNYNGLKLSLSPYAPCDINLGGSSVFIPLPISLPREIPIRTLEYGSSIRIICISRFVVFKVAAVLAIMRYAGNRQGVELLIIGHGNWEAILRLWIIFKRIHNITIVTGVTPDQLDCYIDTCDIGYAQGTSILEIAKRGIPVLIAPYSRLVDLINYRFPTLGIFGDIRDFSAFGDITDLRDYKTYQIADCIERIRRDYNKYQAQTIQFVSRFSVDIVCKEITRFIMDAKYSNQQAPFTPPRPPFLKRIYKAMRYSITT